MPDNIRFRSNDIANDSAFRRHLAALQLDSVDAYRKWCRDRGLSRKLHKDWKRRAHELYIAKSDAAQRRLRATKNQRRHPLATLHAICEGRINSGQITHSALRPLAVAIEAETVEPPVNRGALCQLVTHLFKSRANFFRTGNAISRFGSADGNTYLEALVTMSRYANVWIRPVTTWQGRTRTSKRQFHLLANHLFVAYDMPDFFHNVWFAGWDLESALHREWYLHVAAGNNIRKCRTDIQMTKRMAHFFVQAPASLSVQEALRWSQVRGLGGGPALANAILATRLGREFENEAFWSTVVQWFVRFSELDTSQVSPIVDFLQFHRFETLGGNRPLMPNLCMKRRTPESLVRQVERWHRGLRETNLFQQRQWQPSELGTFEFKEGQPGNENYRHWIIRELVCTRSLWVEGRQLGHCVATYAQMCVSRKCSIWTMECFANDYLRKHVTIEVNGSNTRIIQARGRGNRRVNERERRVLNRWADQTGMQILPTI